MLTQNKMRSFWLLVVAVALAATLAGCDPWDPFFNGWG